LPEGATSTVQIMQLLLFGPTVPIFLSFLLVRDVIANNRSLNDGEYLALLFTRPISMWSYVFTKWLSNALIVCAVAVIEMSVLCLSILLQGKDLGVLQNGFIWLNIILNAFSFTALIVLISSIPLRLGTLVWTILYLFSFIVTMVPMVSLKSDEPALTSAFVYPVYTTGLFAQSFLFPYFDTYDAFNAVNFSILPFVTYISNILLYLVASTLVLRAREFFYAAE
jgi:hypothetical protein